MTPETPKPFDPATNPQFEYVPYDEDPGLLAAAEVDSQGGRYLAFRITTWRMAQQIAEEHPDDQQAQVLARLAEQGIEEVLYRWDIHRTVREKPDTGKPV